MTGVVPAGDRPAGDRLVAAPGAAATRGDGASDER
jgi:hypothetical protein